MSRKIEQTNESAFAPIFGESGTMEKSDKYNWSKDPGEPGTFKMIDKNLLNVDLSYQREARSRERVVSIARNFRWSLFGAIDVVENNGKYYVVDGAHRSRAVLLRSEIKAIPCMVFSAKSIKEEADMFVKLNTTPIGVGAYHRHKAGLVAGYEIAIKAEALAKGNGYTFIGASTPKDFELKCIGAVYAMISRNENIASICFSIMCRVASGQPFTAKPLKGLFYLMSQNQNIDFESFPMKNMFEAGMLEIQKSIDRYVVFKGKGGEKVFAEGMVEIINKGQSKNRVQVPF